MATRMLQRRGSATEWASTDPVLGAGEFGVDPATGIIKLGDGSKAYTALPQPYLTKLGGETIKASAVGVVPLAVQSAAGQTASLFEAKDSSGRINSRITSAGGGVHARGSLVAGDIDGPDIGGYIQARIVVPGAKGLVIRGAAEQTASLAEFQTSAGTMVGQVDYRGLNLINPTGVARSSNAALEVSPLANNLEGLMVKGLSGQSAPLAQFRNSAGTILAQVTSLGRWAQGPTPLGAEMDITIPVNNTGLVIKGAAGQGSNLIEFRNSANSILAGFRNDGALFFGGGLVTGVATAGANGTLPATVAGYMSVFDSNSGAYRKVPFYLP